MGLNKNKKSYFIYILCAYLTVLAVGIYVLNTRHAKNLEVDSYNAEGKQRAGEIGNANFFNKADGKYYEDSRFTIEANDNTEYLTRLFNSENTVNLPAGNFFCKSKIILKGMNLTVQGVKGSTKIVFDSRTFSNYGQGYLSECLIINSNYADEFNETTAQKMKISDISFEYKRYTNRSPKTIMILKNIRRADILNCDFIADLSNTMPVTNLDLYNACKNVTVADCNFVNNTMALSGGCVWVRNLTTRLSAVADNTTENVKITDCNFEKDSKDEVIAVYSTVGNVRNVIINNCKIVDRFEKQEIVLSVYSSEDKYYGTVDNIIISNNIIISDYFNAFIICTGIENRKKPTTNISIYNNDINAQSVGTSSKTIIYNPAGNEKSNIYAINNRITLTGNGYCNAISNVSSAEGNVISGQFRYGITGGAAINNTIQGAESAVVSPVVALRNTISDVKYGIRSFANNSYIGGNTVDISELSGFCAIELNSQARIYCANNNIRTHDSSQYAIIGKGANIILDNNDLAGEGKMIASK
ncbi:hypothetical protein CLHUN_13750 [Ruminiclostridium hungatei]|uniref:Right handed beta helix domain-containing protein n=1 Tax=Ruminiclostridium hungatei TaxID=48256 RepID=A0A1V4SNJ9_RUMHU|nr:hypothetical protein [Ruminiclostridium hungatei]OPX44821.1 hypothetical protein CLHUN_13750 [Ruminiclostridium hungatei]